MSAHAFYTTVNSDAQRAFREAAEKLLDALFNGRNQAARFYRVNPTPENWRNWVCAQAAYNVAYHAENDEEAQS